MCCLHKCYCYYLKKHIKEEEALLSKLYTTDREVKAREEKLLKFKMAQEKDIIDVADFELLYGYGVEWQKKKRALLKKPLPIFGQSKRDGSLVGKKVVRSKKVLYIKKDIELWLSKL